MRISRASRGTSDRYNKGKVVYIDFTYIDHIVMWVQYKTKTVGYVWQG